MPMEDKNRTDLLERSINLLRSGRKVIYRQGWEKGITTEEWHLAVDRLIGEYDLSVALEHTSPVKRGSKKRASR